MTHTISDKWNNFVTPVISVKLMIPVTKTELVTPVTKNIILVTKNTILTPVRI